MKLKERLTEYFRSGETSRQRIGVELEHFVFKSDGSLLPYKNGMEDILKELAVKFDKVFYEEDSILGMSNEQYSLTLEPGAQLEVSINPLADTNAVNDAFNDFYSTVTPILKKRDAVLSAVPVINEELLKSVELIPKKRYEYMDKYFRATGSLGRYMMRGTTSAQVSIDYSDERDFARKYKVAYLISPLLALLAAEEGEDYLKRIKIWNNVDKARTAPPADLFSHGFGYESYARYIADTAAIFLPDNGGYIYTGSRKIRELAPEYGSDIDMIEHYLSMVFPDVRLKTYIEIRIADSMSARRTAAYGGLCAAVMYSDNTIDSILERYKDVTISDYEAAKLSIYTHGLNAEIYGRKAREEINNLIDLARNNEKFGDFSEFICGY